MHDTGARFLYISKSVLMSFVRDVLLRIIVLYTSKKNCITLFVNLNMWVTDLLLGTQKVLKCVIYQPPLSSLRRGFNLTICILISLFWSKSYI